MAKKRIYLHDFGLEQIDSLWLPISAGSLQAYSEAQSTIFDEYEFSDIYFRKLPLNQFKYINPIVATFSTSVWNMNMNLRLAEKIKKRYPRCFIIFGGASTPHDPKLENKYSEIYCFI